MPQPAMIRLPHAGSWPRWNPALLQLRSSPLPPNVSPPTMLISSSAFCATLKSEIGCTFHDLVAVAGAQDGYQDCRVSLCMRLAIGNAKSVQRRQRREHRNALGAKLMKAAVVPAVSSSWQIKDVPQ